MDDQQIQEPEDAPGRGPRRKITRGSFLSTDGGSELSETEPLSVVLEAGEWLPSANSLTIEGGVPATVRRSFCSSSDTLLFPLSLVFSPSARTALLLRFADGEGAGLTLLLTGFFLSRSVIEVGGNGMAVRDEDEVMNCAEPVSRDENIATLRSSHGSTELAVGRDCFPPRRFLVAFSS